MKIRNVIIAATVSLGAIGGGALLLSTNGGAAPSQATQQPPPRPDWVRADGSVDQSKAPKEMPVAGPDGQAEHNPDGSVKMAPVMQPPPPPTNGR